MVPTPKNPGQDPMHAKYESNKTSLDKGFNDLQQIYGHKDSLDIQARSLPQYLYRLYVFGLHDFEADDAADLHTQKAIRCAEVTVAIRSAIGILRDEYEVDILNDRRALENNPNSEQILRDLSDKAGMPKKENVKEVEPEDIGYVFASHIANLFGKDRNAYRQGIDNTKAVQLRSPNDLRAIAVCESQISFYKKVIENPSQVRSEAQRQLRELLADDVSAYLDYTEEFMAYRKQNAKSHEIGAMVLNTEKKPLDFTILPEGTELREYAAEIAESSREYVRPFVDLRRVAVLEQVSSVMKKQGHSTYYVHGKRRGRAMLDDGGTLINEDYMGLVIQRRGNGGEVLREDCLAISPIGRANAGYIVRQDASEGLHCLDVLSQSKGDARKFFNARRLRFDPVNGEDTYQAYFKKVMTLLECPVEEFGSEFSLRRGKDGTYRMAHRGRAIGGLVIAKPDVV